MKVKYEDYLNIAKSCDRMHKINCLKRYIDDLRTLEGFSPFRLLNACNKIRPNVSDAVLDVLNGNEVVDGRVSEGRDYWFINTYFEPYKLPDNRNMLANRRYEAGNYFVSLKELLNSDIYKLIKGVKNV